MLTRTPESLAADSTGRTEISAQADPGGGRCVVRMTTSAPSGVPRLRTMLLDSGEGHATVALVPEGAMLLAGDRIEVRCRVGPGVTLTVVEPAGTVAYDMRGGTASWDVSLTLADGATLIWQGQPFVAAGGSDVSRRTQVELGGESTLVLRETLVLGRAGEDAGTIRSSTRVTSAGVPVLLEDLELSTRTQLPGLLGRHRVLDSLLVLGSPVTDTDLPPLCLEGGGFLYRDLVDEAHRSRLNGLSPWAPSTSRARASAPPRG